MHTRARDAHLKTLQQLCLSQKRTAYRYAMAAQRADSCTLRMNRSTGATNHTYSIAPTCVPTCATVAAGSLTCALALWRYSQALINGCCVFIWRSACVCCCFWCSKSQRRACCITALPFLKALRAA